MATRSRKPAMSVDDIQRAIDEEVARVGVSPRRAPGADPTAQLDAIMQSLLPQAGEQSDKILAELVPPPNTPLPTDDFLTAFRKTQALDAATPPEARLPRPAIAAGVAVDVVPDTTALGAHPQPTPTIQQVGEKKLPQPTTDVVPTQPQAAQVMSEIAPTSAPGGLSGVPFAPPPVLPAPPQPQKPPEGDRSAETQRVIDEALTEPFTGLATGTKFAREVGGAAIKGAAQAAIQIPVAVFNALRTPTREGVPVGEAELDFQRLSENLTPLIASLREHGNADAADRMEVAKSRVDELISSGVSRGTGISLGIDPTTIDARVIDEAAREIPGFGVALGQLIGEGAQYAVAMKAIGGNPLKAVGDAIEAAQAAGKSMRAARLAGRLAKMTAEAKGWAAASAMVATLNDRDVTGAAITGGMIGAAISVANPVAGRAAEALVNRGMNPAVAERLMKGLSDAGAFSAVEAGRELLTEDELNGGAIGTQAGVGFIAGLLAGKGLIARERAMRLAMDIYYEVTGNRTLPTRTKPDPITMEFRRGENVAREEAGAAEVQAPSGEWTPSDQPPPSALRRTISNLRERAGTQPAEEVQPPAPQPAAPPEAAEAGRGSQPATPTEPVPPPVSDPERAALQPDPAQAVGPEVTRYRIEGDRIVPFQTTRKNAASDEFNNEAAAVRALERRRVEAAAEPVAPAPVASQEPPPREAQPVKQPWEMTREEHRERFTEEERRVENTQTDAYIERVVGSRDPQAIWDHYVRKYPELSAFRFLLHPSMRPWGSRAAGLTTVFRNKQSGAIIDGAVSIEIESASPSIVRHEIEHALDAIHESSRTVTRERGWSEKRGRSHAKFARFDHENFSADYLHRGLVKEALRDGKPVPLEVLAEYPDLAQEAPDASGIRGDQGLAEGATPEGTPEQPAGGSLGREEAAGEAGAAQPEPIASSRVRELLDAIHSNPVRERGLAGATQGQVKRYFNQLRELNDILGADPERAAMIDRAEENKDIVAADQATSELHRASGLASAEMIADDLQRTAEDAGIIPQEPATPTPEGEPSAAAPEPAAETPAEPVPAAAKEGPPAGEAPAEQQAEPKWTSRAVTRRVVERAAASGIDYTRKDAGAPLTKTEQELLDTVLTEKFRQKGAVTLGRTIGEFEESLTEGEFGKSLTKPQMKALLSLLDRGLLRVAIEPRQPLGRSPDLTEVYRLRQPIAPAQSFEGTEYAIEGAPSGTYAILTRPEGSTQWEYSGSYPSRDAALAVLDSRIAADDRAPVDAILKPKKDESDGKMVLEDSPEILDEIENTPEWIEPSTDPDEEIPDDIKRHVNDELTKIARNNAKLIADGYNRRVNKVREITVDEVYSFLVDHGMSGASFFNSRGMVSGVTVESDMLGESPKPAPTVRGMPKNVPETPPESEEVFTPPTRSLFADRMDRFAEVVTEGKAPSNVDVFDSFLAVLREVGNQPAVLKGRTKRGYVESYDAWGKVAVMDDPYDPVVGAHGVVGEVMYDLIGDQWEEAISALPESKREAIANELDTLARALYPDVAENSVMNEGFAEYLARYILTPNVGEVAPTLHAFMEGWMSKNAKAALGQIKVSRDLVTRMVEAGGLARSRSQTVVGTEEALERIRKFFKLGTQRRGLRKFVRNWFNVLEAAKRFDTAIAFRELEALEKYARDRGAREPTTFAWDVTAAYLDDQEYALLEPHQRTPEIRKRFADAIGAVVDAHLPELGKLRGKAVEFALAHQPQLSTESPAETIQRLLGSNPVNAWYDSGTTDLSGHVIGPGLKAIKSMAGRDYPDFAVYSGIRGTIAKIMHTTERASLSKLSGESARRRAEISKENPRQKGEELKDYRERLATALSNDHRYQELEQAAVSITSVDHDTEPSSRYDEILRSVGVDPVAEGDRWEGHVRESDARATRAALEERFPSDISTAKPGFAGIFDRMQHWHRQALGWSAELSPGMRQFVDSMLNTYSVYAPTNRVMQPIGTLLGEQVDMSGYGRDAIRRLSGSGGAAPISDPTPALVHNVQVITAMAIEQSYYDRVILSAKRHDRLGEWAHQAPAKFRPSSATLQQVKAVLDAMGIEADIPEGMQDYVATLFAPVMKGEDGNYRAWVNPDTGKVEWWWVNPELQAVTRYLNPVIASSIFKPAAKAAKLFARGHRMGLVGIIPDFAVKNMAVDPFAAIMFSKSSVMNLLRGYAETFTLNPYQLERGERRPIGEANWSDLAHPFRLIKEITGYSIEPKEATPEAWADAIAKLGSKHWVVRHMGKQKAAHLYAATSFGEFGSLMKLDETAVKQLWLMTYDQPLGTLWRKHPGIGARKALQTATGLLRRFNAMAELTSRKAAGAGFLKGTNLDWEWVLRNSNPEIAQQFALAMQISTGTFNLGGEKERKLASFISFERAQNQEMRQTAGLLKAAFSKPKTPKEKAEQQRSWRRLALMTAFSTAMTVAEWWNMKDDKGYRDREPWEMLFWTFKFGDVDNPIYVRVPRPYGLPGIMATTVDASLMAFAQKDPDAFEKWIEAMGNSVSLFGMTRLPRLVPGGALFGKLISATMRMPYISRGGGPELPIPIPDIARWMWEELDNYQTFSGRPIVPPYMNDGSYYAGDQYYSFTSKIGKLLGELMPDTMSPARWDHTMFWMFGKIPIALETYATATMEMLGLYDDPRERGVSEIPFLARFTRDPGSLGGWSQQRLYAIKESLDRIVNNPDYKLSVAQKQVADQMTAALDEISVYRDKIRNEMSAAERDRLKQQIRNLAMETYGQFTERGDRRSILDPAEPMEDRDRALQSVLDAIRIRRSETVINLMRSGMTLDEARESADYKQWSPKITEAHARYDLNDVGALQRVASEIPISDTKEKLRLGLLQTPGEENRVRLVAGSGFYSGYPTDQYWDAVRELGGPDLLQGISAMEDLHELGMLQLPDDVEHAIFSMTMAVAQGDVSMDAAIGAIEALEAASKLPPGYSRAFRSATNTMTRTLTRAAPGRRRASSSGGAR